MKKRRRTLQGGTGRSATYGGVPNAGGWGITNAYLGKNPVGSKPMGLMDLAGGLRPTGDRNRLPGQTPGTITPRNLPGLPGAGQQGPGVRKGDLGFGGGRQGPGTRKGDLGAGGPGGGAGMGGGGLPYDRLIAKLGLPLDPMFEHQRTGLMNARDAQLAQMRSQYAVGNAGLDEQALLGNRQIDENMASRGLFGSGLERRDERLLGNDVAGQKLGLLQQFQGGMLGARTDFRQQLMQSLMDLAQRSQGQSNMPLPNFGPWGNLGNKNQGGRR